MVGAQVGLSRRCMSRLVLKVGTTFSDIGTSVPLRGFRPVRASRVLAANTPKSRSSTRSPRASGCNGVQDRVDEDVDIPLVQMWVLRRDPLDQIKLEHRGS